MCMFHSSLHVLAYPIRFILYFLSHHIQLYLLSSFILALELGWFLLYFTPIAGFRNLELSYYDTTLTCDSELRNAIFNTHAYLIAQNEQSLQTPVNNIFHLYTYSLLHDKYGIVTLHEEVSIS